MSRKRQLLLEDYDGSPFLSKDAYSDYFVYLTQANILFAVSQRDGQHFEKIVRKIPDDFVPMAFSRSKLVGWNEGVLICEKEIARRGLNIFTPKERFEL